MKFAIERIFSSNSVHNVDSAETVNIRNAGYAFSASGHHGKRMGNFTENIVNVYTL